MNGKLEFDLSLIEDPLLKEFAQRVKEEFKNQVLLRGQWRFLELSFTSDLTNFKYPHRLGFLPKDLIQTGQTGTGSIVYNMGRFDSTNIDVTTTGTSAADPLVLRLFLGRYEEGGLV